ncbi:MAG: DUF2156 domain-containing protein [Eubacterium sp.]|nr:DUF2156 domain-containing protein [Eubacterium sp.]
MSNKNSMAQILNFEPIALAHRDRVEEIRRTFGNTLYVYSFASLFAWKTEEQYEICFLGNAFLIKNGAQGENAYLFPCGEDGDKKKLLDLLLQNGKPDLYSLTEEDVCFLENAYPKKFLFTECRDEFIYLYDKQEQIELKGSSFKRLRHRINSGRSEANEWKTEALTDNNVQRALAINQKWAELNNGGLADTTAAQLALDNFSQLSMWGLIFTADGEDTAYVAGSFITPEIFDMCFCKVLSKGCDFFIRWSAYSALPPEVKTVDCEDDLGIEGLRINKLSRHPKELIHIWKGSLIND